ncbi:unnamed protein product [Caenorhabditis angaria]|uniref:Uncharacterized protein n=1 Tax=Caenorhabditis angaria TaxID=860376 RepID=A0A9P1MYI7_9PELO|nr:unnamed protein product [Caenorhabditis angaria]
MKKLLLISLILPIIFCTRFLRDEEDEETEEISTADGLEVAEYCAAVHAQYNYFCRGIWSIEKIRRNQRKLDEINKFCPSYKKACIKNGESSEEDELTPEEKAEHRKGVENRAGEMVFEEVLEKLEEIVPCRPNCDVRNHPHCTRRCKCEYEAKRTKKWCSRPSPRNEYFCQLWYASCSGYLD